MIQDFYSKLSDTEKKFLYATAALLFLVLTDRLFLGPVVSRLKSLDETIVRREGSVKRDLRLLSYRDRILAENRAFNQYYFAESKTEEELIASFLKKIEVLSSEADINLIRVTPSEVKQKKGYREYSASLECSGTLEQVVEFMRLIGTSGSLLRVEKISLSPRRGSTEEISGAMTISRVVVRSGETENPAPL